MDLSTIMLRVSLALLVGGVVGYERSNRKSAAGLRTHILVAVSMAIVSLIQLSMNNHILEAVSNNPDSMLLYSIDTARLAAQALSGIGFIGAGTILHQKSTIVGLTTAASIWAVAVVGLAIGMGFYLLAIVGGVFIVVTLDTLSRFQTKYINRPYDLQIDIYYRKNEKVPEEVLGFMKKYSLDITRVEYGDTRDESLDSIKYYLHISQKMNMDKLVREIYYLHPAITSVEKYGY